MCFGGGEKRFCENIIERPNKRGFGSTLSLIDNSITAESVAESGVPTRTHEHEENL
jgi:hypothetical protein